MHDESLEAYLISVIILVSYQEWTFIIICFKIYTANGTCVILTEYSSTLNVKSSANGMDKNMILTREEEIQRD